MGKIKTYAAILCLSILTSGMAFGQTTITKRVEASTDDAEEFVVAQSIKLTSGDLELSEENTTVQIIGMRFNDLVIPAWSTITSAYIEFVTDETNNTDPSILSISGQDIDNAPTFTANTADISSRTQTTSNVDWIGEPQWLVALETHQTPDISPVIQEIYDRAGWISGNSMVIFVEGTGKRVADSYDGNAAGAALLSITYTTCPVAVSGVITLPSTPGGSDGAVDITATGTSGSYTYSWSNGATTEDISGLSTGTYTVDVTDTVNGCTVSESFEVEFTADLSITKTVSNPLPAVGELITYTLSLTNNGAADATGVVVTDVLPAGVSWSSDDSSGAYVPGTGVWTVGNLNYTNTVTLVVNATVTGTVGSTYPNTAAITSSDQIDNDSANDSDAVDITVSDVDLLIEKTVNDQTVDVGQEITYTIKVTNNGTSTATGIDIQETLPAGVTFVALSSNPQQGTYNETTHVWDFGTLAAGQNRTLQIKVTIDAGTAGDTITNTASVLAVDQTDAHSIADTFESVVVFSPDILITKAVNDASPDEGQLILYTITAKNVGTGATPATGLLVNDDLPAGVTFNLAGSTIPAGTTYDPVTGLWDIGTLIDNVALTLVLAVTVDAGTNGTTVTNTASVDSLNEPVQGTAVDAASVDILVNAPDLLVTKTVSDTSPDEGQTIIYTVNVKNLGPALATGVEITDLLPAGLLFVSSTQELLGTYNNTTGLWVLGGDITVAGNNTITLTITATVDGGTSGTTLTNTASVSALDQTDPNTANNTASVDVLVNSPDLLVTKTVSDTTPDELQDITYTVNVKNVGDAPATGVVISDLLPAGMTFISATGELGGSYDDTTGLWTLGGTIIKDNTITLTLIAEPALGTDGQTITNTASVSSLDQTDPNAANDTASVDVVVNTADLLVTKTVNDSTPDELQDITYTVNVRNVGDGPATSVVIADLLPAGMTFISATGELGGSYDDTTGLWTLGGTIIKDNTITLTIIAEPAAGTSGTTITNTASVSSLDQTDPNAANDTASVDVVVNTADLLVTKTVSDTSPDEGQTIIYTVNVKNLGPALATGVEITDLLPAGLTFVSSTQELLGTYNDTTGLWVLGGDITVAGNNTITLTITATVDGGTSGTTLTNTASVSALDQNDPNAANDTASVDVLVNTPDIRVIKTVSNGPYNEVQNLTYTINIRNVGDADATGIQISDELNLNLTFVSAAPDQGTYDPVTGIWDAGSLAKDAEINLVITVAPILGSAGLDVNNQASLEAVDQLDLNPTNDVSNVEITIATVDLVLEKTVNDTTPSEAQLVTFTIKLTNNGDGDGSGIVVEDVLPAGLTFVEFTQTPAGTTASETSGAITWDIPTRPDGTNISLKFTATVDANTAAQTLTNTAAITERDQVDPNLANNTSSVDLLVNGADLAVTKTVDNPTPNAGGNVTYTIVITNNGPLQAHDITLQDILPTELSLDSFTVSQGDDWEETNPNEWFANDLNVGASATLTLTATVAPGTPAQAIVNTASILSVVEGDSITDNNSDSAVITLGDADPSVTKIVTDGVNPITTANEGDTVVYTVTASNATGPDSAGGLVVNDLLPAGLTYVSDAISPVTGAGSYDSATGVWDFGTDLLTLGSSATLTITATVDVGTAAQTITNTATVVTGQNGNNTANDVASAVFQVAGADISVVKTVDNDAPSPGATITYTVTVANNGPDDATGVQVLDLLPGDLTYVSDLASQGSYVLGTGVWTVGNLLNGQSETLDITVTTDVSTINTASKLAADQPDSNTANDESSVSVAASQTFAAGACVIDMGQQTEASTLKAYGLVYDLIVNDRIPVLWSINPDKARDGVDFSIGATDYVGGPFIIAPEFVSFAQATLDEWGIKGVTIDCDQPAFTAPIYNTVTSWPNAVLDQQNGGIADSAFFTPAEIPTTAYRIGTPADLTDCDDIYVMPHADPQTWDAATKTTFENFILDNGFLWAACHAVSALEADPATGNGAGFNFLSNDNGLTPWGDHSDASGTTPYQYDPDSANDSLAQFIGTIDGAQNDGSEQVYLPTNTAGGWRDTTTVAVWDTNQAQLLNGETPGKAALVAYGRAYGDDSNGMVMYVASHTFSTGTEAEDVAAARTIGNLALEAGIQNRPQISNAALDSVIAAGQSTPVSVSVTGGTPNYTYQWNNSCGGTFDDPNAASTNFNSPPDILSTDCLIQLEVTDQCNRFNFIAGVIRILSSDFGDAPASYDDDDQTVAARHDITPDLYLGPTAPDSDATPPPWANAGETPDGDGDDEDGVDTGSLVTINQVGAEFSATLDIIEVTNNMGSDAQLVCWIDFDKDGTFSDTSGNNGSGPNERSLPGLLNPILSGSGLCTDADSTSYTSGNVPAGCSGSATLLWTNIPSVPTSGMVYSRCRITTDGNADNSYFFSDASPTATGAAADGEVEDNELPVGPTAVIIGDVGLESISVIDYLAEAELDQLQALLASFGMDADGMDRTALIAALIEFLDPDGDGQVAVLQWDTLEERGTIGFYVERKSDVQDDWVQINNQLLPGLITAPMGGEYQLLDPGAQSGLRYQYRLIELEATGDTRFYGPFTLQMP